LFLFGLFCAFKTSTTDLVHFYDIITVENVGTTIPLSSLYLEKFVIKLIINFRLFVLIRNAPVFSRS
jgi:hypothetical protein